MNKWLWIVLLSLLLGMGMGFLTWKLLPPKTKNEILSPLVLRQAQDKNENKFQVVGFLPTWMIGKTKMYGSELTQLIFSGIEVNKDGSLLWDFQSKKINNDDYVAIKNNVKAKGGKNLVSIKLFIDKNLDYLVANAESKSRLYAEVRDIVVAGGFDGVNVDFEYMSDPIRILDDDMIVMFEEMKKAGWGIVNVDVFANTIIKGDVKELDRLARTVDGVIIMAYDFHRPGSEIAGAVAPMMADVGQRSIAEIVNRLSADGVAKEKFVMAYPLYGYQWETINGELNSPTMANGYGVTILYKEGIGYTAGIFDDKAKSPWFAWIEKEERFKYVTKKVGKYYQKVKEFYTIDQWHQAYLENEDSLKSKIEVVKQAKIGGTGFWALGYEGKTDLIEKLIN